MNQPPNNPFESPNILDEAADTTVVDQQSDHQISVLIFVSWCLFMLIAMVHFGFCFDQQDMVNGVLFCLTGVVGFILIIPTRGTVVLALLYAFSVSISCAMQAVMYPLGYHTLLLIGFVFAYAIVAAILGYTEYQQWEKKHG